MDIVTRLKQLAHAVADEDWSEFSMRVPADSERDADLVLLRASKEIESLRAELAECKRLLRRYRTETVLGHQPHMIAHEVDAALAAKESE